MFEIEKPISTIGIGVDQIPESIRLSTILTGNDLGLLGSVEHLPSEEEVNQFNWSGSDAHQEAQSYLAKGQIWDAWMVLLS